MDDENAFRIFLESFNRQIHDCAEGGGSGNASFAQPRSKSAAARATELALDIAGQIVDLINSNSKKFSRDSGHLKPFKIYDCIRSETVKHLVNALDVSVDFAEFVVAYECLLDHRLAGRAGDFRLIESQKEKRKRGVFYTPASLASDLTLRAILPLALRDFEESEFKSELMMPSRPHALKSTRELLQLKIVDPAMGAGTFLLSAMNVLTDCILTKLQIDSAEEDWKYLFEQFSALQTSVRDVFQSTMFLTTKIDSSLWKKRQSAGFDVSFLKTLNALELRPIVLPLVAVKCLYGTDIDAGAVELAKIGIAKNCGFDPRFAAELLKNLRTGNALIGLWAEPAEKDSIASPASNKNSQQEAWDIVCSQFFDGISARELGAFHWPLEFPEVFSGSTPGFDLVLTNPPWEIEKANSREFFSRYDAAYMALSKQDAIKRQEQLLQDDAASEEWKHYCAYHEGLSNFLHQSSKISYLADESSEFMPFSLQGGGDLNSYKLFLELGYFLAKDGGVMAQIVPSGIYSDKGATELRRLFLERCRWLFLHGYHNRDALFDIHRSFKFCTIVALKGGRTESVNCSFLKVSPADVRENIAYGVDSIKRLSPKCLAFTEVFQSAELQLIEKTVSQCQSLAALEQSMPKLLFRRELDMTNDSHYFVERGKAEQIGFVLDSFGHWLKGRWRAVRDFKSTGLVDFIVSADRTHAMAIDDIESVLLPVYEGRMIGQYDWAKKGWLSGKGRRADWTELQFPDKKIMPQYLIDVNDYFDLQPERGAKIAYLAVGASTNSRTLIASLIGDWPCGNAVPVLRFADFENGCRALDLNNAQDCNHGLKSEEKKNKTSPFLAALLASLNSYVFDFMLRMRLSANNLNWFILQECFVPDLNRLANNKELLSAVYELSSHEALCAEGFPTFNLTRDEITALAESSRCNLPAAKSFFTAPRRLQLRAFIEALIAVSYSIDESDCKLILRGCELEASCERAAGGPNAVGEHLISRGFHRVDSHLPADLRGPSMFFKGFQLMKEMGSKRLYEAIAKSAAPYSVQSMSCGGVSNVDSSVYKTTLSQSEASLLMSAIRNAGRSNRL